MARLSYLGTLTIRQDGTKTEATGARYDHGKRLTGRYWGSDPLVSLHPGHAVIRFHDGDEHEVILTHTAPDSGRFIAKPS